MLINARRPPVAQSISFYFSGRPQIQVRGANLRRAGRRPQATEVAAWIAE
jgi:hypothetical protein